MTDAEFADLRRLAFEWNSKFGPQIPRGINDANEALILWAHSTIVGPRVLHYLIARAKAEDERVREEAERKHRDEFPRGEQPPPGEPQTHLVRCADVLCGHEEVVSVGPPPWCTRCLRARMRAVCVSEQGSQP